MRSESSITFMPKKMRIKVRFKAIELFGAPFVGNAYTGMLVDVNGHPCIVQNTLFRRRADYSAHPVEFVVRFANQPDAPHFRALATDVLCYCTVPA